MQSLYGMNVHVSPMIVELKQKKIHDKRKWMSEFYHQRINKKWLKRFGKVEIPSIYVSQINKQIFIHPILWESLQKEIKQNEH